MTYSYRPLVSRFALAIVAGAAFLAAPRAEAVGTRSFDLATLDDFSNGADLKGVSVDSLGRVRAGWNLGTLSLPGAGSVTSSLGLADGSVLLGTGPAGKVFKVSGGQVTEHADTKETAVVGLVTDGKSVYAGTLKGTIHRLDGAGKSTEIATIPDGDHVLAMAWDAKKAGIYVATGPNGRLFFVHPTGAVDLVFDSDEPQLSSVAVADDGTVFAGSTGKGLVFKITGPGRASILLDCPGDEAKGLAWHKGHLFVIANDIGDAPEPPRRPGGASTNAAGPSPVARIKVGKGALLRIDAEGRSEELFRRADTHFVSLALDDTGRPFVGTAAEGRVYTVDDNHTSALVADTDERQIGAIGVAGKTHYIVGSDPAVFHEIRGTGGADATWTSKVLDAGLRASFGRLTWRADGNVELSTRTGNSATPDATWSDWSAALAAPGKTTSPPGRFVQMRARFAKDANAVIREVELPFVTDNVRAVVTSIEAKPKGASSSTSSTPSTAGASSGGALPSSGGDVPARVTGLRLSWRTDNPDGDTLRYRVQFRFDGPGAVWRDITKPDDVLSKAELEWDTASLPEGTYRIRVEATDELSNPPDRITRHGFESGPILVDNTAPVFRTLTAQGRKLKADIVDGLGPIARVDFALDGRTEWRPLLPKDGVFDEPTEEIDVDLSAILSPGPHLVAVRAFDRAGNFVVRDIELKLRTRRSGRGRASPPVCPDFPPGTRSGSVRDHAEAPSPRRIARCRRGRPAGLRVGDERQRQRRRSGLRARLQRERRGDAHRHGRRLRRRRSDGSRHPQPAVRQRLRSGRHRRLGRRLRSGKRLRAHGPAALQHARVSGHPQLGRHAYRNVPGHRLRDRRRALSAIERLRPRHGLHHRRGGPVRRRRSLPYVLLRRRDALRDGHVLRRAPHVRAGDRLRQTPSASGLRVGHQLHAVAGRRMHLAAGMHAREQQDDDVRAPRRRGRRLGVRPCASAVLVRLLLRREDGHVPQALPRRLGRTGLRHRPLRIRRSVPRRLRRL